MLAQTLVFGQGRQNPHVDHGGGDFPLTAAFKNGVEHLQAGNLQLDIGLNATLGNKAAKFVPALAHVLHFRAVGVGFEVR